MNSAEILTLLTGFEKRLTTIVDQATETVAQAQHTLDRLNRLRRDLEDLHARFLANVDTGVHTPLNTHSSNT
jgi:hypothetical protein